MVEAERLLHARRMKRPPSVALFSVLAPALVASAVAIGASAIAGCGSSGDASTPGAPEDSGSPPGDTSSGSDSSLDAAVDGDTRDVGSALDVSSDGDGAIDVHPCSTKYPRLDLKKDFLAAGDGKTDDTPALAKAAAAIQKAGGGELMIPPGVYLVGSQSKKAGGAYYDPADMFKVSGLTCLKVSGYGATLRVAPGLHYGGFDTSGVAGDFTGGAANAAAVGRILELSDSDNVLIEGVELDGNNEKLVLGGQWGDVDRQASATGLWMNKCQNVMVVDVHTHHHGLDGITVLYLGGPPPKKMPHKLVRVVSEYNGRQALSWIGGWGLEAVDSKFNHTGRAMNGGAPLMSKPRAGLDIEPNAGTTEITREGVFTRCEFIDNAGAGIVTAGADAGYSTFDDCTIWGTTTFSLYLTKPGMKFRASRIYGTATHGSDGRTTATGAPNAALATSFENCTFEDKPWTDGRVYLGGSLYDLTDGVEGMSFTGCTFSNHGVRGVLMGDVASKEIFDGCTFVHGNAGLSSGTYQSQFEGSEIRGCHFEESSDIASGSKSYFIKLSSVNVTAGGSPTHVDGPKVHWQSPTGLMGDIPVGPY